MSKEEASNSSSLRRRGFTLVELIVVIAILGILAGIAVPVYSGYIQRAREAGDQQLLGAVNTAFAAACQEQQRASTGLTDACLLFDEAKHVMGVSAMAEELDNAQLNGTFLRLMSGNTDLQLRSLNPSQIGFDNERGVFYAPAETAATLSFFGGTEEQRSAFFASNLGSDLQSTSECMGQIRGLLEANGSVNIWNLSEFQTFLGKIGIDAADPSFNREEYDLGTLGLMWVADELSSRTAESVYSSLQEDMGYTSLSSMIKAKGLAAVTEDVAAMYSLAVAFSHTEDGKNQTIVINKTGEDVEVGLAEYLKDPARYGIRGYEVVQALYGLANNGKFQEYFASDAAMIDLGGLSGAMGIINGNIAYGENGNGLDYDAFYKLMHGELGVDLAALFAAG